MLNHAKPLQTNNYSLAFIRKVRSKGGWVNQCLWEGGMVGYKQDVHFLRIGNTILQIL